jgi:hypothetical protein
MLINTGRGPLDAIAGTTVENVRRYLGVESGAEINEVVP